MPWSDVNCIFNENKLYKLSLTSYLALDILWVQRQIFREENLLSKEENFCRNELESICLMTTHVLQDILAVPRK